MSVPLKYANNIYLWSALKKFSHQTYTTTTYIHSTIMAWKSYIFKLAHCQVTLSGLVLDFGRKTVMYFKVNLILPAVEALAV